MRKYKKRTFSTIPANGQVLGVLGLISANLITTAILCSQAILLRKQMLPSHYAHPDPPHATTSGSILEPIVYVCPLLRSHGPVPLATMPHLR